MSTREEKTAANIMSPDHANSAENKNTPRESLFARVTRESQERRHLSDRRSAERRAAEQRDIAKQIAARVPKEKPKAPEGTANADVLPNGDEEAS